MVLLSIWMGPMLGGLIAGILHVLLGPDHVCTIITLSACQGAQAFWFGVTWAIGHLAGLVVIGVVVLLLDWNVSSTALQVFEHVSDYLMGLVLILFGAYFLVRSEKYFDATWKPRQASCSCHSEIMHCHPVGSAEEDQEREREPLMPAQSKQQHHDHSQLQCDEARSHRKLTSIILGFIQGIACPASAVGFLFLREYTWRQGIAFGLVFFPATVLAMGTLAMTYGHLTQWYASRELTRWIYYFSCSFSMLLGFAWILMAFFLGASLHSGH
eukprot:CAMPEP_0178446602 /NCGR_PEP_ID=MMETSP0689_2-20121128/40902_1 /TAXON_ID=160604 /ORGANISM="Amphidinium massartii, Strain CS-259" /LENGTH=269 /DNA_ID=CAMNT_0020071459 /DNA_START=134 /DNA_END=940 /DNA_ORIENTATION=-